ncbi:type II CAAX endopeptidase family protein [Psychrobacillus sp. BL-248-WT-3]|uniref:CPBP family intramembrane glutamic endopeptidase n=2 Tax=unclassified Psychrobacillus TaxID=2636677 RepID=UPI00146A6804|nr:type II CAAX endopeptidase family protein [Psychrobacillus sp. BL-248-WT-3]
MIATNKNSNTLNNFVYAVLLMLTGYGVSYFNNQLFNGFGTFIWFTIFILLSISFSSVRNLIVPLINFKPFKSSWTYLYMLVGIMIPYLILKLSVHYEILMDRSLIVNYKNGWLEGPNQLSLIDAVILAPIWEELLFRGVLLFALLKVVKPVWAVVLTSILFSLFHPAYLFLSLIAGILLACITIKTKSVIPSTAIHSTWNLYTGKLFLFF